MTTAEFVALAIAVALGVAIGFLWFRGRKSILRLVNTGKINLHPSGGGLSHVSIGVELMDGTTWPLTVRVPSGTVFFSPTTNVQNMISTLDVTEVISEHHGVILVPAACLNMHRDQPGVEHRFKGVEFWPSSVSPLLKKLIKSPAFQTSPSRIRQFAIWTITDNPPSEGFVGISARKFWGWGKTPSDRLDPHQAVTRNLKNPLTVRPNLAEDGPPSAEEIEAIKALFQRAGLETKPYRALSA